MEVSPIAGLQLIPETAPVAATWYGVNGGFPDCGIATM